MLRQFEVKPRLERPQLRKRRLCVCRRRSPNWSGHLDQEISMLRSQLDHWCRPASAALESSRRFFEAQEFPLALRKIQEALELDPHDPDALALMSQVERERRERKIDEWLQLARQHAAIPASGRRARRWTTCWLKPNETTALQLLHEVDRKNRKWPKHGKRRASSINWPSRRRTRRSDLGVEQAKCW
jgi:serine/threonine-protein kinase